MVQINIELIVKVLSRRIQCLAKHHDYITFPESQFEAYCKRCGAVSIDQRGIGNSNIGCTFYEKEILPKRIAQAFESVYGKAA